MLGVLGLAEGDEKFSRLIVGIVTATPSNITMSYEKMCVTLITQCVNLPDIVSPRVFVLNLCLCLDIKHVVLAVLFLEQYCVQKNGLTI